MINRESRRNGEEIQIDEPIAIESIISTCFSGRVVRTTRFGPHEAIIPEVEGTAALPGGMNFSSTRKIL